MLCKSICYEPRKLPESQNLLRAPFYGGVELALEDGGLRETAAAEFEYQLSDQDREDIRW